MRVDKSSSLSGLLGELAPSGSPCVSPEAIESASFSAEVNTAVERQDSPAGAPSLSKTLPGTAHPQTSPESILESEVAYAAAASGLEVVNGLIALPPSKLDATGEATLSKSTDAPVEPVSASNLVFNLVTGSDSASMAAQCRLAVDAELRKIGLDPQNYKMSFWEECVGYPGGSFMNRCITVETPEGQRMDFNADLTLRSPHVTAGSIQLLQGGYWATAYTSQQEPRV
jgi:hypothetical protein